MRHQETERLLEKWGCRYELAVVPVAGIVVDNRARANIM